MNGAPRLPFTIRRARVPTALLPAAFACGPSEPYEPAVLCDLTIAAGKISAVQDCDPLRGTGAGEFDAGGRLVFPAFVEAHTHLDKAHTWCRAPNRSGTFMEADTSLARDMQHQTPADLRFRGDFCAALRLGTRHPRRAHSYRQLP